MLSALASLLEFLAALVRGVFVLMDLYSTWRWVRAKPQPMPFPSQENWDRRNAPNEGALAAPRRSPPIAGRA